MRRLLLPAAVVVVLLFSLVPFASAQTDDDALVSVQTDGSLLLAEEGGSVPISVTLSEPGQLRLRVVDFDGRTVRELYDRQRRAGVLKREWFGRDDAGEFVPHGPYRIVAAATVDGVTERAASWITVSDRAVYAQAPEYITVAIDPGHGGDHDGALAPDGTREADLNLDISLRLARMLRGAGVNALLTRTVDGHVNEPPEDRTADGVIDYDDELAARPDAANLARADLFISVHNNEAVNTGVGGPSTYFSDERPYAARNARLARVIQDEMVEGIVSSSGWEPYDHGTLVYPYYVLRAFDPPRLRRPTQMPAVLSEGMFLSNPRELKLLKRRDVRTAMADAYYKAISKYLARRGPHLGYALVEEPAGTFAPGEQVTYRVEVRNQGTEAIRDWNLDVEAVKAQDYYAGRIGRGDRVGEARIPRLAPGASKVVEVTVELPDKAREWSLIFDARDRDKRRASGYGIPPLQTRVTTVVPVEP